MKCYPLSQSLPEEKSFSDRRNTALRHVRRTIAAMNDSYLLAGEQQLTNCLQLVRPRSEPGERRKCRAEADRAGDLQYGVWVIARRWIGIEQLVFGLSDTFGRFGEERFRILFVSKHPRCMPAIR